MKKSVYSIHQSGAYLLIFSFVMLLCARPGYAQTNDELSLETISSSNIDKLELLASWQPDGELLTRGIGITPAKNEDFALIENRLHSTVGIIDLKNLKLEPVIHFTSGDILWNTAISPNGQFAATKSLKVIDIWNTSTGETTLHTEVPDDTFEINQIGFSSNSEQFAYATNSYPNLSPQDGIYIYDLTTEKQVEIFQHPAAKLISFSPDGEHLASGGYDGSVRIWDLGTGDFTEIRPTDGNSVWQLDFVKSNLLAVELTTQNFKNVLEYWDTDKNEALPIESSRQFSDYRRDGIAQISMEHNTSFQLWSILQQKDLAYLNVAILDIDVTGNLVITSPIEVSEPGIQFRLLDTGEIVHSIKQSSLTQGLFSTSGKHVIAWDGPTGFLEVWGVRQR